MFDWGNSLRKNIEGKKRGNRKFERPGLREKKNNIIIYSQTDRWIDRTGTKVVYNDPLKKAINRKK